MSGRWGPARLAFVGGLAIGLVIAILATGLGAALSPDLVFVVERADTGETIIAQPVANGTTVGLVYTHSVEQSRVYDGYAVRGERLELTRMEFESYGWGLPAGANVTRENGTFVYDPPGTLRELSVSPGEIAGHRLQVGERSYDLVDLADGRTVRLSVERPSPLEAIA
jgi:hypothetical protein